MENSADPDELAFSEVDWSGSTLFAKAGHMRVQPDQGYVTNCKVIRCSKHIREGFWLKIYNISLSAFFLYTVIVLGLRTKQNV